MENFEIIPLGKDFRIEDAGELAPVLPSSLSRQIDTLWQQERARRGDALFNGSLLTLVGPGAKEQLARHRSIAAARTEYRLFVAQTREPALYEHLSIRPLAVTGIVRVGGEILLGRRAHNVTQDAGCWEFSPSGGLTAVACSAGGLVDPALQILQELEEEGNIPSSAVQKVTVLALMIDHAAHVHDIVLELKLSLTASEIADYCAARGSREYSDFRLVSSDRLPEVLRDDAVSASSRVIAAALLRWPFISA